MAASLFSNQLELDSNELMTSKASAAAPGRPRRNNSYDSSSTGSVPEMIMSSSLQSFPESDSDSLNDSLSSSTRSLSFNASPTSPRSIFKTYWGSPLHEKGLMKKKDEDEVMARLSTLQLPSMYDDENDSGYKPAKIVHHPPLEQKAALDDASIDYKSPQSPRKVTPRRQILPTPPPQTAVSSSLILPRQQMLLAPYGKGRKWNSTTALLRAPNQSCLRKSRYSRSCSAIAPGEPSSSEVAATVGMSSRLHHGLRNEGHHDLHGAHQGRRPRAQSDLSDLKKSVSFYSRVSVFEFAVPPDQRRGQDGWSDYFA